MNDSAESAPESLYPVVEGFVEVAEREDVDALFGSLKAALGDLKGPRKENAKKVQAALQRTEELLAHLLDVRDRLEAEQRALGKSR